MVLLPAAMVAALLLEFCSLTPSVRAMKLAKLPEDND